MNKERPKYAHEEWKEATEALSNFDLLGATLGVAGRDIPERINLIIRGKENWGWVEEHGELLPQLAYERFLKFRSFIEDLREEGKNHRLYPKAKKHIEKGIQDMNEQIEYLREECNINTEHRYFENPKGANPKPTYPVGRKPENPELKSDVKRHFLENEEIIKEVTGNSDSKIAKKLINDIPELKEAIDEEKIGKDTPRTWVRGWNNNL